jgi:hypothetical protein
MKIANFEGTRLMTIRAQAPIPCRPSRFSLSFGVGSYPSVRVCHVDGQGKERRDDERWMACSNLQALAAELRAGGTRLDRLARRGHSGT